MLKHRSLAKITILLLSTASLGGIAVAQTASPSPIWPSNWSKPADAAQAVANDTGSDPLSVLDETFTLDETVQNPLAPAANDPIGDNLLGTLDDTVSAPDPLTDIEGISVPDQMPGYISDAPVVGDSEAPASATDSVALPMVSADASALSEDDQADDKAPSKPIRVAPSGRAPLSADTDGAKEFASGQDPDPVAAAATELVRQSGLIARQSDMGEGLLLMDRQLRFAENVNQMIGIMGPDVEIEVAPGVYKSYADTPAGRKAQLEMKRLEQEAEFANLDFKLQLKEREAKLLEGSDAADAGSTPSGLRPLRSDGSEFQDINNAGPQAQVDPLAGLDPAVVAALSSKIASDIQASMPKPEPVAPVAPAPSLSVREIFGLGGEFVAILTTNGERVRVRKGDDLPNGIKVISVGEDFVEIETNGAKSRLSIRG